MIGGVPVGPEHTKFIRKVNTANVKIFMNDMRVKGVHTLKFQNINKVNCIVIHKIYIKLF